MRDYLIFVADIADAQQRLLNAMPSFPVLGADLLRQAALAGVAPLPAPDWVRDPAWRGTLRALVAALQTRDGPAQETLVTLAGLDDEALEQQADRLLNGVMLGLDLGAAPLIAAALQVYFTRLVLLTQELHGDGPESPPLFGRVDESGACPCCAMRPASSIVRIDGPVPGQRYLHCALCSTQWHKVRIECTHCGSDKVHFQSLQTSDGRPLSSTGARAGAVQAECCDACDHYLKIVHMDKDPQVDPIADDLASLTLDLLVAETGKTRHGINLMLLFGDPEAPLPEAADG